VLVAQPEDDGASWLWTIAPLIAPVTELVAGDHVEAQRAPVLTAYGAALADALKVEAHYGTLLDLSPSAFGVVQGAVRYIGTVGGEAGRDVGQAVMRALEALARVAGGDIEPAIVALEGAIPSRLTSEELAKLARTTEWREPASLGASLDAARKRIAAAFERGRKAA